MYKSSAAVMARRNEPLNTLDDYPTPPGATRALLDWLERHGHELQSSTVFEPAAGRGYMADVLQERFGGIVTADINDYGYPLDYVGDFLAEEFTPLTDWLITNPPFKLLDGFIHVATEYYERFAFLARVQALEGQKRYRKIWSKHPPSHVLIFINRVAMVQGGLAGKKASSAVAFAWYVWDGSMSGGTQIDWIWYTK